MKKCIFILSFLFPALLLAQGNETTTRNWSLKTDLLNPVFKSASLEVERRIGEKTTLAGRFGLTWGNHRYEDFEGKLFGYYAKIGPKFYLSDEKVGNLSGFAIQPQLMFSYWRNWNANVWGNHGAYWEHAFGLIIQGSYGLSLGNAIRLEPMVGIGYAPTFYGADAPNDTNFGPAVFETRWEKERWEYIEQPSRTHIPLPLDLAVSVGLHFGVSF